MYVFVESRWLITRLMWYVFYTFISPLDESAQSKFNFLISLVFLFSSYFVLWVLKTTVSMGRFFRAPKHRGN